MNEKERDLYAAIHKEQARSERETLPPDLSCFEDFVTRFEDSYKKEESTSQNKPVDLFASIHKDLSCFKNVITRPESECKNYTGCVNSKRLSIKITKTIVKITKKLSVKITPIYTRYILSIY